MIVSKKNSPFRVPENRKTEDQEEGLERTTRKPKLLTLTAG